MFDFACGLLVAAVSAVVCCAGWKNIPEGRSWGELAVVPNHWARTFMGRKFFLQVKYFFDMLPSFVTISPPCNHFPLLSPSLSSSLPPPIEWMSGAWESCEIEGVHRCCGWISFIFDFCRFRGCLPLP